MPEIKHSVTCDSCGEETYEFERYCHRCGFDRWDGETGSTEKADEVDA